MHPVGAGLAQRTTRPAHHPARFDHFEKLGADSIDGSGLARYTHMREAIAKRDNQEKLFEDRDAVQL